MRTISELFDLAQRYHRSGNLQQAESICRQVLEADPAYAAACQLLGLVAHQAARHEEAVTLLRRAIVLNPAETSFHFNLAIVFTNLGQRAEAIACYRQGLRLEPQNDQAHNNLGNALRNHGQLAEAVECFRQALRINPEYAAALNNLGIVMAVQGQSAQAVECYRQALRIDPGYADAHYNLGIVLKDLGQGDEAAQCYREAARLNPQHAAARINLGSLLQAQGDLAEAADCYREALRIHPKGADAYNNLGIVRVEQGQLDEALACYRQARTIQPENEAYHSNLLYCLIYHPRYDSRVLLEEHRRWESEHALALARGSRAFANNPTPQRRLRIGYVSPDFRDHVVGRNIWPLLRSHDPDQFEITLYANMTNGDWLTERVQRCAQRWRGIAGLTDDQVAQRIEEDGIDILVDLALHMSGGRLLVFARKPAPVQVTFAGYPGTTGLAAIDYRLSDPYLDPPGRNDACYAETTYRLPHSFWCYDPQTEEPTPAPLPALANRFVTFGCLNHFCKVNDEVLELWARILRAVQSARLLLLAKPGSHRQRTLDFLARRGIAPQRIEFFSFQPRPAYLALYRHIDIGLDTFPYNGHTTSLDSLWMGVPVITLVGQTVVGRAGLSQLTNLGLAELAATTPDDFVRLGVDLAGDIPRLQSLRAGLRERLRQSPLMDAAGFARGIEQAYRDMWRTWCARQRGSQS